MDHENANDIQLLQKSCNFSITPSDTPIDFSDKKKYQQVTLSEFDKLQILGLAQQLPAAMSNAFVANTYVCRFPDGLAGSLMKLNQGGYGSPVINNGRIAGAASFYAASPQAIVLSAFTAMSALCGQYFLTKINNQMTIINEKLDRIIDFLYGEKKAELLAEINFVQSAHRNYPSIMKHELQRQATLVNIQASKKIALKDMEYYSSALGKIDLDFKKASDADNALKEINMMQSSFVLSAQLYTAANALEVFYSSNYDTDYLFSIKNELLNTLHRYYELISPYNGLVYQKVMCLSKKSYYQLLEMQSNPARPWFFMESELKPDKSPVIKAANKLFDDLNKPITCYLSADGDLYISKEAS